MWLPNSAGVQQSLTMYVFFWLQAGNYEIIIAQQAEEQPWTFPWAPFWSSTICWSYFSIYVNELAVSEEASCMEKRDK